MKNRILALSLAFMMVLALASIPGLGTAEGLSGTIRFSTWGSVDEKIVNEEIIKAFEEDYPGCKVELEFIPEEYIQKIETMFVGGNAPDVIYGHPHYFANWASMGMIKDLTPLFEENEGFFYDDSRFYTSMYEAFKVDGKNVGTINGSDTFLLFYNKNLFDQAGVGYPTDQWTWNDVVDAGQAISQLEVDGIKCYGINVDKGMTGLLNYVFSMGGSFFDSMDNPTAVTVNSENTIRGLQFAQDMVYKHGIAPTPADQQMTGVSFDGGKVGMDITGMWAVVFRKGITDFEWDVANLPLDPQGSPRKTAVFYAGYCVYEGTQNPELAMEFAKYFQSERAQKLLAGMGLITVIDKVVASSDEILKGEGMPENHHLRVSSVEYAENGYPFMKNTDEMMAKCFSPVFDQLMANSITAQEAVELLEPQLNQMLEESKR